MLGAIIGDIVGSDHEFHNLKSKEFDFFTDKKRFTDDTVMTVAVAHALMDTFGMEEDVRKDALIDMMKYYGRLYPHAGYGHRFKDWLRSDDRNSFNSWGNGSGMRVSSAGWFCKTLKDTLELAALTASVTHDHPEGIRGAQAIAGCVYLARRKECKDNIERFVVNTIGYDMDFTLDQIRADYKFDVSCQGSCPQAIKAFLESESFEDTIRLAVSIGGDTDTIACMAGAIAEAHYGIPDDIMVPALNYLPESFLSQLLRFKRIVG